MTHLKKEEKKEEIEFIQSMPTRARGGASFIVKEDIDSSVVEVRKKNQNIKHGVGVIISSESVDKIKRFNTLLSYAFHYKLKNDMIVSVGAALGISQFQINIDELTFKDQAEPYLQESYASGIYPDLNLGGYLYNRKFYAGISASQFFQNELDFARLSDTTESSKLNMHYYITGGYNFDINERFILTPSTMIRYTSTSVPSIDLNGKLTYDNKYWIALGYRNQDALSFMAGIHLINVLNISYAYDYVTSDLNSLATSSHEIFLSLRINKITDVD